MPVILPTNKKEWDAELWYNSVGLISSWLQYYPDNVVAIETNFKSLDEAYFKPFTIAQESYNNIFQYVDLCGLRPGIFSEDPVGPKGLASRWGDWHMKNSATDIRGDHLLLMSAPYFKTAVITGDRYDVWFQIDSIYNLPPSSSGVIAHFEGNTSTGTDIANTATESIIIRYISGSIVIDGLNKNDIDSDIILYDTQGRLIYKDKVKNSPQTTISTILPRGIYILKLSGNRQITVKLSIN
jgi:hypothetical protein